MLSFHNDPAVKQKYIDRVTAHAAADRLIQGTGWERGKGCAIGCTLEAYDHSRYPVELGLPEWLAHLEDRIFEALPTERAMHWPSEFLAAVPVGVDVEPVKYRLTILRMQRLLPAIEDNREPYAREVETAVRGVIAWCEKTLLDGFSESAARSAESAA